MPSFAEFLTAYNVFAGDGSYSGGSWLHIYAPWETPIQWQDNLTQLPDGITEEVVLGILANTDTIVLTCTDKDMVYDAWEMHSMGGTRNVWMITVAGGAVQPTGERYEAMRIIATWLYEKASEGRIDRLGCVAIMNHNEVCGAVKQWNNNESLVDLVQRVAGKTACMRDFEENTLTTALIRHGAKVWEQFRLLSGVMYNLGLYDLQRDGQGKKSRIRPLTSEGATLSVEDLKNEALIKQILG